MLRKKNKFFKQYKLNKLQKIIENYKYIYFLRYNDLNIRDLIFLKKNLNKLNYNFLILNQKLTKQIIFKLNGHGSILMIYGNNYFNCKKNIINFKKFKLIYLIIQNHIYSYLKIKSILNQDYCFLNNSILYPFLNFIYYLRKI